MKRFLLVFIISVISIFAVSSYLVKVKSSSLQSDMASKIIRFHVIANSDSQSDQKLKLKVRDEVLKYMTPKLKNCKDINESRKVLKENNEEILNIANKVIKEQGYSYNAKSSLTKVNFPIKSYGNITLPQGTYEAYRIIIGSGKGQNWWCVMFPPLCFVDITKGQVSYKQVSNEMKKVLTPEEYKMVNNNILYANNKKDDKNNIKVKFKILEVLKDMGLQI
ncbi:stage II sporulation protein R [Clostridium sp. WILCCON 0269]|uniref:Stage II sporulation protein R n=1 Tax=Candidatus Clostridium eludens TaxID=3381663 RepID=A0ABW8SHU7_9CLOT